MTTDNKTLADVQPGARVRLGDALPPLPKPGYVTGGDYGHEAHNAYTPEQMRDYARAALSAQPSPGSQDALAEAARRVISDVDSGDYGGTISMATYDALVSALTARQPAGEIDEAAVLRRAAAVLYMWEDDPNLTGYMGDFKDACGILELLAQHAAPPAQAMDLGPPDPTLLRFYQATGYPELVGALEEHVLKLIDLRKRNVKPWEDTMPPTLLPKWIRENSPVLAKDLLALADRWQDEAAATWGEAPAHAAKQQCCDELRALIDSQAVGNGN